jgi:predicted component of type VI protein secretion system
MAELAPEVNFTVENTIAADGSEERVSLRFATLKISSLSRLPAISRNFAH